jgi:hypothetical protein
VFGSRLYVSFAGEIAPKAMGSGAGKKYETPAAGETHAKAAKVAAPTVSTTQRVDLEEDPVSPTMTGASDDFAKAMAEAESSDQFMTLDDVLALYPEENFEITIYADLKGLRPGGRIELSEFRDDARKLNELEGKCKSSDVVSGCWHIVLDDRREVRVFPHKFAPCDPHKFGEDKMLRGYTSGDPHKGKITFHSAGGTGIPGQTYHLDILVDPKWHNERTEHRSKRKPSKQISAEAEPADEVVKDKVVKRRSVPQRRGSTIAVPDVEEVLPGGFRVGDHTAQLDDKWAGDAVIIGKGANPGSLLVQFVNGGKTISLPPSRLRRRLSRRPSLNDAPKATRSPSKQVAFDAAAVAAQARRPSKQVEDTGASGSDRRSLQRRITVH